MKKNSLSKHAGDPLLKLCYLTLQDLSGDEHREMTYRELAERFFVDTKTARRIIAILENFVSHECNETIALEGASYNEIQRNPHSNPYYMPKLRLTLSETEALLNALVSTGLENNDLILDKLSSYTAYDADIDEILKQNYTADHTSHYSISPWTIAICCLSKQRFSFNYRKHDGSIKSYVVDPLYVMYKDSRWYMNAWDIEDDKQKFFVLSKMKQLTPINIPAEAHNFKKLSSFTFNGDEKIEITFKNGAFFDIISHSALEYLRHDEKDIVVLHDATQPEWIARQIVAGGGKITTNDKQVQKEAKRYASELINKAKSF